MLSNEIASMRKIILQGRGAAVNDNSQNTLSLFDIFNQLADGRSAKQIMERDMRVKRETVLLARAFICAQFPSAQSYLSEPTQRPRIRILIDENISPRLSPLIRKIFGHAHFVEEVSLKGKPDTLVWERAIRGDYDAILTQDKSRRFAKKDLTEIALNHARHLKEQEVRMPHRRSTLNNLPLIIHVRRLNHEKILEILPPMLYKHQAGLRRHIEERITPYIMVDKDRITRDTSFADLDAIPESKMPEQRSAWKNAWKNAILKDHKATMPIQQISAVDRLLQSAALIRSQQPFAQKKAELDVPMMTVPPAQPSSTSIRKRNRLMAHSYTAA